MDNEAERQQHAATDKMMKDLLEAAMELTEQGFEFPFHIVLLGLNGSLMGLRFEPDEGGEKATAKPLVDHIEGPGFAFPINVMLVDARGKSRHMLIRSEDVKPEVIH